MGLFGGNGFQGPGEEFGNSWDSFSTGQGNFLTDSQGNKSGPTGNWSNTGTQSPSGGAGLVPLGDMQSAISSAANPQPQGLFGGNFSILGMIDKLASGGFLSGGGKMSGGQMKTKEKGLINNLQNGFFGNLFGGNSGG